jgi:L-ascorbate metabolism protein UlaG (beta-lactamase superfamily)
MIVQYFGEGCFRLQSGEISLLLNPLNNRLKADVVLKTLVSAEAPPSLEEISLPGEYEVKGIEIQGFEVNGESTGKFIKIIYAVDWEDMRFVFLGHISHLPPADILEELVDADIVFVPTGDSHFLPAAEAVKLLKQIAPKVIIPAYYQNANELVKALGLKAEEMEKFVFRKKDLTSEKMRLLILKREA